MFNVILLENGTFKRAVYKSQSFELCQDYFYKEKTTIFAKKFRNNRKKIERVNFSLSIETNLTSYDLSGYKKQIEVEEKFLSYLFKKHHKFDIYVNQFLSKKRNFDFYFYKNKVAIVRNNKIFDVLNFLTADCAKRFYYLLPKQNSWMFFDELHDYNILQKMIKFCGISEKNFYRKSNR